MAGTEAHTWVIIDGVDLGTLRGTQAPARRARADFEDQIHDLRRLARPVPACRQILISLEQSRPWLPASEGLQLGIQLDRGSAPLLRLGLLCLPQCAESVVFVSARYGWHHRIESPGGTRLEVDTHELRVWGQPGPQLELGGAITIGPRAGFEVAFGRAQPGMERTLRSTLGEQDDDPGRVSEACFPFLPALDLFADVLVPAAAPVLARSAVSG